MKTIEVTMQEIWMASRPLIQKSKKNDKKYFKNEWYYREFLLSG